MRTRFEAKMQRKTENQETIAKEDEEQYLYAKLHASIVVLAYGNQEETGEKDDKESISA